MRPFPIEDDVVALVRELGKPQEWESFSDVLRRVLTELRGRDGNGGKPRDRSVEELFAELDALPNAAEHAEKYVAEKRRIRAASPDPQHWGSRVEELRSIRGLNTWQAICSHLRIEVGGDSARRKLQEWVKRNRPGWPPVPDVPEV
jgi:hypothetical protein